MRYGIAITSRFRSSAQGASAVEFALILPLFLMLLFGIIMFGAYFAVVHGVQQLAAEAARNAVGGLSDAERADIAAETVRRQAPSYLLLDPQRLTLAEARTDGASGTFTVQLRYDATEMVIFSLPRLLPMPPTDIIRSAAIRRGGY